MFIKRHFAAGLAAALIALACPAMAATVFSSTLTADQEVAPTASTGTGEARYEIRDNGPAGLSLVFEALFDPTFNFGLTGSIGTQMVTALHIHGAPRGQNGAVVFGILNPNDDDDLDLIFSLLADGSTRINGEWDATEGRPNLPTFTDIAPGLLAIQPGQDAPFYLNLHTTAFPGGEIRGQLVAAPVPLPAGLPLLAAGILLLAYRGRARHGATGMKCHPATAPM